MKVRRNNSPFSTKYLFKTFLIFVITLFFLQISRMPVHAQIAGGTYDGVDWQITDAGELIIGKEGQTQEFTFRESRSYSNYPWYQYRTQIKTGSFKGTVKGNGNMNFMFYNCNAITSLSLDGFDTSNVTKIANMFSGCESITSLDVSNFDTSNVTTMNNMFENCKALASLDVSNFDTSNVISLGGMFMNCQSITNLDLSNFNTSNVLLMGEMFSGCTALATLDVSGFDTSNVETMENMFNNCGALTNLDVSGFDTSNVTDMSGMFSGCGSLTSLDVSGFDTSNITSMYSMFQGCQSLTSLDVSGFDTSNVVSMERMFYNCKAIQSLDVSGFNTSKVRYMHNMFYGCNALSSLDVSGFDTSKVSNMSNMFDSCFALTSLDVSGFDTSNVTDMSHMFASCRALTSLDISGFDTSNVTRMQSMFYECNALTSLDVSNLHTSNVTNMSYMFSGCKALTSLDVSGFNTSNVTDMSSMFTGCISLTSLDVSGFNTSKVTSMQSMFHGCNTLTSLDLSGFDTSNVTSMNSMFSNCTKLTDVNLSSFNTSNVTNMSSMFNTCSSLTDIDVSSFNTSKVTNMSNMFNNCSLLTSLNLNNFNTTNVTNMSSMFQNCRSLTSLDLNNFNTANVTNMSSMFNTCRSLADLNVSSFNTSKVTNMSSMFASCGSMSSLDISNFDMTKTTSRGSMFYSSKNLSSITLGELCKISGTGLTVPPTASQKWRHTQDIAGPYTAAQLMSNYNAARAGTWEWDVQTTEGVVTFVPGAGTTTASNVKVTNAAATVTMPSSSTTKRSHYILVGWSKNPNATPADILYTPGQAYANVAVLGEITPVYAVWETTNLRDYKVKHYKEKSTLDGYSLTTTETLQADYGTSITPDRKTYAGFTTPPAQTGVVAEDDSLVIEYYYDYIRNIIKFDGNGSTSGIMEDQVYIYNVSQPLNQCTYSKKGSVFTGWNTQADGTGTAYTNQQAIKFTPANTIETTLYAQWLDNSDNQMDIQNGEVIVTATAGQTIVIPDLPAGTKYTIEEINIPDGWTLTNSSNTSDTVVSNQTKNSSYTNSYSATGSAEITAHKTLSGRDPLQGEFVFELLEGSTVIDSQTNGEIDNEPYVSVENSAMTDNPWYKTSVITFSPISYTFNDIGTHTYTIREVAGNDSTIIYDPHVETVTVTVSDGGHGGLKTEVTYDSDGALFENSIQDGSILLSKTITGSASDNKNSWFTFIPVITDENGNPINGTYNGVYTMNRYETITEDVSVHSYGHTPNINDDGTKIADFDATPGSNYICYSEVISIPNETGLHVKVRYSDIRGMMGIWEGTHTVTWGANGPSNFTADFNPNTAAFFTTSGPLSGYREDTFNIQSDTITLVYYCYRIPTQNEWTNYGVYVDLYKEGTETITTNIRHPVFTTGTAIALRNGETYEITGLPANASYTITEESIPGWVNISATGDTGTITPGGQAAANFINTYNAEGSAIITATKHLTGETLTEDMFNFELLDEDMNTLQLKPNDALGNIIFDAIEYGADDAGKTFTYFIREKEGTDDTYVYDNTVYPVTVTVQDNGTGVLEANIVYPDGAPVFENSATKSITVGKQVTGSMGSFSDSFEFTLELTGENVSKHQVNAIKNGAPVTMTANNGVYTFTLKHDDTITFTGITPGTGYRITETSANKNNYTTSVDNATTGTIQNNDISVTFTNNREIAVNTGVDTGKATPILILLCLSASTLALIFLKKKRQYDSL